MNHTNICPTEVISNLCNTITTPPENTFSNITPFLPLIGIIGPISIFLYQNRPQIIEKKEIADYINYETNTRYHEYSFTISWGHDKINWNYVPLLKEIKSIEVQKSTKTEFYYLTRNTGEEYIPKDCLKIKGSEKRKKIYFTNIGKIKFKNIETIYLITKDKEKSSYRMKIKENRYPDDNMPEKIMVVNENKINIQNYEIVFTEQQSKNMIKRNGDCIRQLIWNNSSIADCFVEGDKLKIILKEIPKNHGGLAGTTMIHLL